MNLLIIGCGGHSKVVTEIAETLNYKNIKYLEINNKQKEFMGFKVFSNIKENYNGEFIVALGDNFQREKIYLNFLSENKLSKPSILIHPKSFISKRVTVGLGTVIMPHATVNTDSIIGSGAIVNTSSILEHDCFMDDFSSLSPGAKVGGGVSIGKRTAIGIGACVNNGIEIEADVVLGSNSLATKNISKESLYYGNPAKFIKKRSKGDKYL